MAQPGINVLFCPERANNVYLSAVDLTFQRDVLAPRYGMNTRQKNCVGRSQGTVAL